MILVKRSSAQESDVAKHGRQAHEQRRPTLSGRVRMLSVSRLGSWRSFISHHRYSIPVPIASLRSGCNHGGLLALSLRSVAVMRAHGILAQAVHPTSFLRPRGCPWEFREERHMCIWERQVGEEAHGSCR